MMHTPQTTVDQPSSPSTDRFTLRRHHGPLADELWVQIQAPRTESDDTARQTSRLYRELQERLRDHRAGLEHIVSETVYLRDPLRHRDPFLNARRAELPDPGPAITMIGQPSLDGSVELELLSHLVVPHEGELRTGPLRTASIPCCPSCPPPSIRTYMLDGREHLWVSGILGRSNDTTFEEAYHMFRIAGDWLRSNGLTFAHVVRTWIYLRHMERDYDELNRARRRFFEEEELDIRPASTGIEGAPPASSHDLTMSLLAVTPRADVRRMSTETLNEAWDYGSDFSRGLRMPGPNGDALYISGTASVDEEGRTVHLDDLDAQVERMLVNIEGLLAAQNSSWSDLVSATTYLKNAVDAPRLKELFRQRQLDRFPHVLVNAAVCRPDLLVEMEAIAMRPPSS